MQKTNKNQINALSQLNFKENKMNLKKYLSVLVLSLTLITLSVSTPAMAAEDAAAISGGLVDDSIRDMTVVLGSGAVGAILGLSTLSFVDHPSDHWKNVAIGGAVGIVVGVGAVIFQAASRTTTMAVGLNDGHIVPMNPEKLATLSRHDFMNFKIAKDLLKEPSLGYTFQF
jgi:hypothetical protein